MSRRFLTLAVSLSLIPLALAAPVVAQDAPEPPTATPNPEPLPKPQGSGTGIRITTDLGDVLIGLFDESAPVASQNFRNLIESGYYDGTGFHRVVRDFVIQGGDPEGTGRGGPGYTIVDEDVVGTYGRGIVAMARTPAPNSQGSQFFVVLDDSARPALESANTYVIFGRVLEGMDVVDAIAAQGPESNAIEDPVRIISTSVEAVELPEEPDPPPPSAAELAAETLTDAVPASLAGFALDTATFSSDEIFPGTDPAAVASLTTAVEANGAVLEEFAIVSAQGAGPDGGISLLITSIPGVPAAELREGAITIVLGGIAPGSIITEEEIDGVAFTRIAQGEDVSWRETIQIVEDGDRLWFVVTDFDSLPAALAELPLGE